MIPRSLAAMALGSLLACSTAAEKPAALTLQNYRLLDLTYSYDDQTLSWPAGAPFEHTRVAWGYTAGGYWYSSFDISGSEHGGTHLDAPIHFAEGGRGVAEIPVEQLVAPGVVIDIAALCARDPDYMLTVSDIEGHEQQHGAIPAASIVLLHTGWGKFWPNAKQYYGDDTPGKTDNLHFPGISAGAAHALVERKIAAIGIDTASIDRGPSRAFEAHQAFAAAAIPGLENVARLDELPASGSIIVALPMKIGGGSGAPCRIVALLPK